MAIARVAMPIAAWQLFDYWAPDGLALARGDTVRARLAGRAYIGVVAGVDPTSEFADRLQPIEARVDAARLPEEIMALASFVSEYYQAPPGLAYALVAPPAVARGARKQSDPAPEASRSAPACSTQHRLHRSQTAIVDAVIAAEGCFAPTMLHGVTGSGKTDVYLAAAARLVADGAQALILVPEI